MKTTKQKSNTAIRGDLSKANISQCEQGREKSRGTTISQSRHAYANVLLLRLLLSQ